MLCTIYTYCILIDAHYSYLRKLSFDHAQYFLNRLYWHNTNILVHIYTRIEPIRNVYLYFRNSTPTYLQPWARSSKFVSKRTNRCESSFHQWYEHAIGSHKNIILLRAQICLGSFCVPISAVTGIFLVSIQNNWLFRRLFVRTQTLWRARQKLCWISEDMRKL